MSEAFNAKARSEALNPASLLPKLNEATAKIRNEIRTSKSVAQEMLSEASGSPEKIERIKSHHAHYIKALEGQISEIDLEYKKISAIVETNLHNPLEFLRSSANTNNNANSEHGVEGYNPVDNFEIFDRHTGEDSFFTSPTKGALASRGIAFAVADGVGGWSAMGVDPSAVSKGLCYYMRKFFCGNLAEQIQNNTSVGNNNGGSLPSPKALLGAAFSELESIEETSLQGGSKSAIAGGSTACVGIASASTGTLHTANLGDSGYIIYRSGKIAYQSEAQVHAFNTPYQLSIVPEVIRRLEEGEFDDNAGGNNNRRKEREGKRIRDMPKDADTASLQLKHGDIVVFATDGFWDNVFTSTSLDIVNKHMISKGIWAQDEKAGIVPVFKGSAEADMSPELAGNLALQLVNVATANARNPKSSTPFAKEFIQEWKVQYDGGKPDDTTVLVVYVHDSMYKENGIKPKL